METDVDPWACWYLLSTASNYVFLFSNICEFELYTYGFGYLLEYKVPPRPVPHAAPDSPVSQEEATTGNTVLGYEGIDSTEANANDKKEGSRVVYPYDPTRP